MQVPQNWDGSPSFRWRVNHWFWYHIGFFILVGMVALWFLAPSTAVAILDANMAMVRQIAKWIAAVVPIEWGGAILSNVIALMDKLTEIVKEMVKLKWIQDMGFGPRTEIIFRMLFELAFLYLEIKVIRFLLAWIVIPISRFISKGGAWLSGRRKTAHA